MFWGSLAKKLKFFPTTTHNYNPLEPSFAAMVGVAAVDGSFGWLWWVVAVDGLSVMGVGGSTGGRLQLQ